MHSWIHTHANKVTIDRARKECIIKSAVCWNKLKLFSLTETKAWSGTPDNPLSSKGKQECSCRALSSNYTHICADTHNIPALMHGACSKIHTHTQIQQQ